MRGRNLHGDGIRQRVHQHAPFADRDHEQRDAPEEKYCSAQRGAGVADRARLSGRSPRTHDHDSLTFKPIDARACINSMRRLCRNRDMRVTRVGGRRRRHVRPGHGNTGRRHERSQVDRRAAPASRGTGVRRHGALLRPAAHERDGGSQLAATAGEGVADGPRSSTRLKPAGIWSARCDTHTAAARGWRSSHDAMRARIFFAAAGPWL